MGRERDVHIDSEFNVRNVPALRDKPVSYACAACGTVHVWRLTGDHPARCETCSKQHNARVNAKDKRKAPIVPSDGPLLDQLDTMLHWAPTIDRWLCREGDRWGRCSGNDAYRLLCRLLDARGERRNADKTLAALGEFRAWCVARAAA